MSGRSADERIRDLVGELRPVRPIPRLRAAGAAALGIWGAALAADQVVGGPGLRPLADAVWSQPAYLAGVAGLAAVAIGFTLAALASAVPGREAAQRLALGAGAIGMFTALGGGFWALRTSAEVGSGELAHLAPCLLRALGLGAASSLLACVFMARAVLRRPLAAACFALAGGVALGALAVHTTCPADGALHHLVAHELAPALAVALLGLPLAAGLHFWRARAG